MCIASAVVADLRSSAPLPITLRLREIPGEGWMRFAEGELGLVVAMPVLILNLHNQVMKRQLRRIQNIVMLSAGELDKLVDELSLISSD